MITVNQQPVTQKPEDGMKQPTAAPRKSKHRPPDYQRGTPRLLSRVKVFSPHTHYESRRVASEDGLDAWARHAAASNGFGGLT